MRSRRADQGDENMKEYTDKTRGKGHVRGRKTGRMAWLCICALAAAGCGEQAGDAGSDGGGRQAMDGVASGVVSALYDPDHAAPGQTEAGEPDNPADRTEQTAEKRERNSAGEELIFWYGEPSYRDFFEEAARRYNEETGARVTAKYCEAMDYPGEIYDKTMQDDAFPDVYLIPGDNLEEMYLYGLASVNETGNTGAGILEKAAAAATYRGKSVGYPLSFNTCVFVFQTGYFETAPDSIQAIIDYARENEPAEHTEYLLEWDVNDAFYDFPFISNSVTFEKTERESMTVSYNEELYRQDLAFFEEILESFSVDAQKVSEDSIIENFLAGRTLCAIIDTDSLYRLDGYTYSLMEIPALNAELDAAPCAITDMLVVNAFSEKGDLAADFATFVTVDLAAELYGKTGHYSVIPPAQPDPIAETAYKAYETAVPAPDSQDAKDFWAGLRETIAQYF